MLPPLEKPARESSLIAKVGYDEPSRSLGIQLTNGDIFVYHGVTREQFDAFDEAESQGRYFGQNIKGKVSGTKMTGYCSKCFDGPGLHENVCGDCGTATYDRDVTPPKLPKE